MLISLLEVCLEGGVKKVGTLKMIRVSDWRHEGQGYPWCDECTCILKYKSV